MLKVTAGALSIEQVLNEVVLIGGIGGWGTIAGLHFNIRCLLFPLSSYVVFFVTTLLEAANAILVLE